MVKPKLSKRNKPTWLELSIKTPSEYVEPLSVVFQKYSYGGVAVEQIGGPNPDEFEGEWEYTEANLRCYLPIDNTTETRKEHIRIAVALISRFCTLPPLQEKPIRDGEWMDSWKKHFSILTIGRIIVCPSWKDYTPRKDDVVIMMDPGMAFGTGYHPTTHMCLSALDKIIKAGDRVLDIGTGSGILAIASAKLGANYVLGLDIDELAIKCALDNIKNNQLLHHIDIDKASLIKDDSLTGTFDVVVANIYAKVIIDLAPDIANKMRPGGYLILSGITDTKENEVHESLAHLGFLNHAVTRQGDWVAISKIKT